MVLALLLPIVLLIVVCLLDHLERRAVARPTGAAAPAGPTAPVGPLRAERPSLDGDTLRLRRTS